MVNYGLHIKSVDLFSSKILYSKFIIHNSVLRLNFITGFAAGVPTPPKERRIAMNFLGFNIQTKNTPPLDPTFIPMHQFNRAFLVQAKKPISICIERNGGLISTYDTFITGTNTEADRYYVSRLVKFLLWSKGGCKVIICGDDDLAAYIKEMYSPQGQRAFDSNFMSKIYERPFEVVSLPLS